MSRYRITLEAHTDQDLAALRDYLDRSDVAAIDGIDELTDARDANGQAYPRAIILRRRATDTTDTPGDFLPFTDSCSEDYGGAEPCQEIAVVLVVFSDGTEQRLCARHLEDVAGWRNVDNQVLDGR